MIWRSRRLVKLDYGGGSHPDLNKPVSDHEVRFWQAKVLADKWYADELVAADKEYRERLERADARMHQMQRELMRPGWHTWWARRQARHVRFPS